VSPALKPLVTQANLKLASPRLRLIKAAAEVAPGVTTFDTAGHTPGSCDASRYRGQLDRCRPVRS
jgi:hypothetical protein